MLAFGVSLAPYAVRAQLQPGDVEPAAWARYQVLAPLQSEIGDNFGAAVALGSDLAVVGASAADGYRGKVHLYSRQGSSWVQEPGLQSTTLSVGAGFGASVSLAGSLIVVGAPNDADTGSAYVFERSGSTWTEIPLAIAESAAGDQFGFSVAASPDTVIVGAPSDSTLDAAAGAAYVFVRKVSGWEFQARLLAADAAVPGTRASHLFGVSVSLEQDTAVVGAPNEGAAYVFQRSGETWSRTTKLSPLEPQEGNEFGISVALSGDVIAVGADLHDETTAGFDAGAVYTYVRGAGGWPEQESAVLYPEAMKDGAAFGFRLSLSNGSLMVSAPYGDPGNTVYPFVREGSGFSPRSLLAPNDLVIGDSFGMAVTIHDQSVLVGVPNGYGEMASAHAFALAPGSACSAGFSCSEGFCVEGVCCAAACDGGCESCIQSRKSSGPSGACGFVKSGTDPHAACGAASCLNETTEDPAETCDGLGACVETAAHDCRGYVCSDAACKTACSSDTDCDEGAGFICSEGRCLVPLAGPCATDAVCESGNCAKQDGMCCNEPCAGPCEACTAQKKGAGRDGICGAAPADTDPDEDCEADAQGDPCGATGTCDGKGQCRSYAPPTTACRETTCAGESASRGWLCSGEGECRPGLVDCGLYQCRDSACGQRCQDESDCAAGAFCGSTNNCQPQRDDDEDCGGPWECTSGHCVAGRCSTVALCSDDRSAAIDLDNKRIECEPFACSGGRCLETCLRTSDCAAEYACNSNSQRCELEEARSASVSGCTVNGAPSENACGALLALGVLGYLRRIRPRRRLETHSLG
jgi:hypothetical protein